MIKNISRFLFERSCVSAQIVIINACEYLSDTGLDDMISYLKGIKISREIQKDLDSQKGNDRDSK